VLKNFKESDEWQGAEAFPVSHKVQRGPPCFLNAFSDRRA